MHLLKERSTKEVITACGASVDRSEVTVWVSDVDCPQCKPQLTRRRRLRRGEPLVDRIP